jgi:hypothetical protein
MATATIPSGAAIASDALKYAGAGYTYGGNGSRPGVWDCSSFVSYVLGHDFNLALPGGGTYGSPGYPPNAHGPVVLDYAAWTGATTIQASEVGAGDLCVFAGVGATGHIGIATDNSHMISALDSTDGPVHTPIQGYGPAGAPLIFRRLNGSAGGGSVSVGAGTATGSIGSEAGVLLVAALFGAAVPVILIGAVLVGAALVGLVGLAAVTAVLGRREAS